MALLNRLCKRMASFSVVVWSEKDGFFPCLKTLKICYNWFTHRRRHEDY